MIHPPTVEAAWILKKRFLKEQKHRSTVQLIRKADGFVRENINMFLLTQ